MGFVSVQQQIDIKKDQVISFDVSSGAYESMMQIDIINMMFSMACMHQPCMYVCLIVHPPTMRPKAD